MLVSSPRQSAGETRLPAETEDGGVPRIGRTASTTSMNTKKL